MHYLSLISVEERSHSPQSSQDVTDSSRDSSNTATSIEDEDDDETITTRDLPEDDTVSTLGRRFPRVSFVVYKIVYPL